MVVWGGRVGCVVDVFRVSEEIERCDLGEEDTGSKRCRWFYGLGWLISGKYDAS